MNLKTAVAAVALCAFASSAYAQQPATTTLKPAKQIDSVWNGVLIGAGAGAVGAWIFTRVNCGPAGYDNECSAIAALAGTALFVPAGMLTGGIIDRLINKTLPPGADAHAAISPFVSRKNGIRDAGAALTLKIRF